MTAVRAPVERTDSDEDIDSATRCANRNFPIPGAAQFRVDLDGDSTLADWSWPDFALILSDPDFACRRRRFMRAPLAGMARAEDQARR